MSVVTVSSHLIKNLVAGLVLKNIDPKPILRDVGVPTQILSNDHLRVSTIKFAKLIKQVIVATQDEAIGQLTSVQPIGVWEQLFRTATTGRTLAEALQIWSAALNLLDTPVQSDLAESDTSWTLIVNCPIHPEITNHCVIESQLNVPHRYLCWLGDNFFPIESVQVTYPQPIYASEYRYLFYGAPVTYNSNQNSLTISKAALQAESVQKLDALQKLIDTPQARIMTQNRQATSLAVRMRLWIEKMIREDGLPAHLENAASHFGMNSQTLSRHLKKEGLSFGQLKEDTRRDMALHMLGGKEMSVEEVGFAVGFSEASTFIRAFKQWTGLTPRAYKQISIND